MNPPTTHHRDRYRFREMVVGTPRTGCSRLEAQAANVFSAQNKDGIKLIRRKQEDNTYTIWRIQ